MDLNQDEQAYKVWRAGITDDFDDEYLTVDPTKVEILDDQGKDVTEKFNIQLKDGVLYAFARLVDTEIPATGETAKGDPQPEDLKAYSESTDYDPLKDPAIDQTLLGHTYQLLMPYTVRKVDDGKVVENTAVQIVNQISKTTNTVSNPLKPINPVKDVTVQVAGDSIDGQSVYKDTQFLYRLDSSVIPANRAYPEISQWTIADRLDPQFDQFTGQWAVYAARDIHAADGSVLAAKGERIAGSGFDPAKFGGDLLTLERSSQDGRDVLTIKATDRYLALVAADTANEAAWSAYVQVTRLAVTERHENQFTETMGDQVNESNIVWTRTPDLTPSLSLEKWDKASGWPKGDRDDTKQALTLTRNGTRIVFTITNTSKTDNGSHGAVFRAKDLKLEDMTIAGDGSVTDITYPDNWDTLVLKPGDSVDVTGTLKGVTRFHTDRAKVTGKPYTPCVATQTDPFGTGTDTDGDGKTDGTKDSIDVDGVAYCGDTVVESNTDDWSGKRNTLAKTGSDIAMLAVLALVLVGGAGTLLPMIRRGMKPKQARQ